MIKFIFGFKRFYAWAPTMVAAIVASKMRGGFSRVFNSKAAREVIRRRENANAEGMESLSCVLYHYPCIDGAFAALAAHLYHSALGLPTVFLPNSIIDPLRAEYFDCKKFHTCYLLDFLGPEGFAIKLSQMVKQVVVLDHHKTAVDSLEIMEARYTNIFSVIDMNRSGATIAYEYFNQKLIHANHFKKCERTLVGEHDRDKVELLFRYVEDADLWRWSLPDSKAFIAGLSIERPNLNIISNPSMFDQLLKLDTATLITNGKLQLQNQQMVVQNVLEMAFTLQLGGGKFGKCLAVRADAHSELRSELGNTLSVRSASKGLRGIGAVIYELGGKLKISLRTTNDSIDTTEISRHYGGGGHPGASSFFICQEEFRKWKC